MSDNNTGKQIAIGVGAAILAYALWEGILKKYWFDWLDDGLFNRSSDGDGGSGDSWGTGGAGSGSGAGGSGSGSGAGSGSGGAGGSGSGSGAGSGSGGAGGAGGTGTGGVGDYSSLAAAIQALAAGVRLPNIQTVSMAVSSGVTALVPGLGGKRTCVLAYAVTATGAVSTTWKDGASYGGLWQMDLDVASGNSGANLATAWPGYLFATSSGNALNVETDGNAQVCVSYWQEDE